MTGWGRSEDGGGHHRLRTDRIRQKGCPMRRLPTILAGTMLAGLVLAGTSGAAQAQQVSRPHATPGIFVSPSPVEFGRVRDGHRIAKQVFIENLGPGPMDIGNVSISEDIDFSGGGGGCQFTVPAVRE